jgi:hypothetical protein
MGGPGRLLPGERHVPGSAWLRDGTWKVGREEDDSVLWNVCERADRDDALLLLLLRLGPLCYDQYPFGRVRNAWLSPNRWRFLEDDHMKSLSFWFIEAKDLWVVCVFGYTVMTETTVVSRGYSRENILRERGFPENILREIISREFSRIFFLLVIKHRWAM